MALRGRILALLSLAFFAAPLRAGDPDPLADIQQIQQQAEAVKAEAEACARMKCPECDCASLAKMMQALVDAETVMDALHNALIDADADLRKHYFDLAANSHLTGVKLAQLQDSLAWQEFFHKLGSYLLKMESILNTLNKNIGSLDVKGVNPTDMSAGQAMESLDSLANLAKNVADIGSDLTNQLANGEIPATPEAKDLINSKWDVKSEGVDVGKLARDAHDAFKEGGAKEMFNKLKGSRNLLTLLGRTLKIYSERKIKDEKAVLKELTATEGPEAEALTRAFQEWQRVREQMFASGAALASIRAARNALAACMAKAGCGSQTLSRPTLGPFKSYGEALPALGAKLPAIAAALKGGIVVKDRCPEKGKTPQPPKETPGTTQETPLPPPRHVVENNCPKCSGIALELARTLDQREFVVSEVDRIRKNGAAADDLEKSAQILRDYIQRLTDLAQEWRNGKKDRNALLKAGDALFRKLGQPDIQINLENLEREKRDQQNALRTLEERMKALRAEEGQLPQLWKENDRLYSLAEKLKADLAECQKSCVPPPPRRMTKCFDEKAQFDHWDLKQKNYPSSSNKKERDAALRKLCECLKSHPEEMTEELRKLCPDKSIGMAPGKPGKIGNSLVGFVYSSDTQANDKILGTVVDNPKDWEDSPLVTVVELAARLPIDDSGKPILRETTVSFGDGPAQSADQPVSGRIPPGGATNVSVGTPDNPAPGAQKPVTCPKTGTTPVKPPPDFQTPPVGVTGGVQTIDGPFTGDPKETSISVNGEPASVVTGTPRSCNYTLPSTTQPGPATTTCRVDGKTLSARTAVVGLALSAKKTDLMRGESTEFSARVLGLDSIPDACWETPYAPERIGRLLLSAAAPGMELREGQSGKVLLVIENRSPEIISIEGERGGRIVLTIDRSSLKNGVYEFKGKIHSHQRGSFNIHATVIPLMAPVQLRPLGRE